MRIKYKILVHIISQMEINWRAVFLGFGSNDRENMTVS